jgi:hypothetical protein
MNVSLFCFGNEMYLHNILRDLLSGDTGDKFCTQETPRVKYQYNIFSRHYLCIVASQHDASIRPKSPKMVYAMHGKKPS